MSIWLYKAGYNGEFEAKFLYDNRIYFTLDNLGVNLKHFKEKPELYKYINKHCGLELDKEQIIYGSQAWPIAHGMNIGDWIILPSGTNRTIHFGEIVSNYQFDLSLGNPFYHYRDVIWFGIDIPQDRLDLNALLSLGTYVQWNLEQDRLGASAVS